MVTSITAAFISLILLLLAVRLKLKDQVGRDKSRKTYIVTPPSGVTVKQLVMWMYTLSSSLTRSNWLQVGRPSVVFEVWSDERGLKFRLKVPWQQEEFVIASYAAMFRVSWLSWKNIRRMSNGRRQLS